MVHYKCAHQNNCCAAAADAEADAKYTCSAQERQLFYLLFYSCGHFSIYKFNFNVLICGCALTYQIHIFHAGKPQLLLPTIDKMEPAKK